MNNFVKNPGHQIIFFNEFLKEEKYRFKIFDFANPKKGNYEHKDYYFHWLGISLCENEKLMLVNGKPVDLYFSSKTFIKEYSRFGFDIGKIIEDNPEETFNAIIEFTRTNRSKFIILSLELEGYELE